MFGTSPSIRNLSPRELDDLMRKHDVLLIDVREPAEFAAERIHGALNFPLSTFDPAALPEHSDRAVVFQCGSGKRSATAIDLCRRAGLSLDQHLAGGIAAWRGSGRPTVTLDPASGSVRDPV